MKQNGKGKKTKKGKRGTCPPASFCAHVMSVLSNGDKASTEVLPEHR